MRRVVSCLLVCCALVAGCGSGASDVVEAATQPTEVPAPDPTEAPDPDSTEVPAPDPTEAPDPDPTEVPAPDPTEAPDPDSTEVPAPDPTEAPDPDSTEPPDVETYDAPGELELPLPVPAGNPGEIIDVEELGLSYGVGQRLLYHSTATDGSPVAVSGFVVVPAGDAPDGGWPLIAWAHGTTGLGDLCAPSHKADRDELAQALVAFGYAVVATDYEGLGTPGLHPYIVGRSEAHGVLDSVRAVRNLDLPVSDDFVVFGHSQGGHAAMFTGQLYPTYAPELNLIGVVAGAPPSQMADLGDSLIGSGFQGYLIMTAAGLAAAYDELSLSDVLSDEAMALIDVVEDGCVTTIFSVYNPLDYDDLTIVEDLFSLPAWNEALTANDTNQLPVPAPLLIIHGGDDEQIPVETSAALFDQLCDFAEQGPTIRNVYPEQSHAGVLRSGTAVLDLVSWVEGRFSGAAAPDDCER